MKIKTKIRQLFCKHDYIIGIAHGMGGHPYFGQPFAEIICGCRKCNKKIAKRAVRNEVIKFINKFNLKTIDK